MKKYLQLFISFFKVSFVADLEYRMNFAILILGELIWYSTQLLVYEVLFRHVPQIGGWGQNEMRVFVFLALFIDCIYMILWEPNFSKFNDDVRKGQLDLLLTKPVNSIFMLSSQKISISHLPCLFITGIGTAWALLQIDNFNLHRALLLLLLIPSGLAVIFCGRFALNATAIIFTRADFLQYLWYSLLKLGLRPDGIYTAVLGGSLRRILIFVLPFAMIASIPTRILIDPTIPWGYVAWAAVMPFLFIFALKKYWNYCLKFYSSASS